MAIPGIICGVVLFHYFQKIATEYQSADSLSFLNNVIGNTIHQYYLKNSYYPENLDCIEKSIIQNYFLNPTPAEITEIQNEIKLFSYYKEHGSYILLLEKPLLNIGGYKTVFCNGERTCVTLSRNYKDKHR